MQWLATDTAHCGPGWFPDQRPDGVTLLPVVRPTDDGERSGAIAAADPEPKAPLTGSATGVSVVEGEVGLVHHWLDNTAHISG